MALRKPQKRWHARVAKIEIVNFCAELLFDLFDSGFFPDGLSLAFAVPDALYLHTFIACLAALPFAWRRKLKCIELRSGVLISMVAKSPHKACSPFWLAFVLFL